MSGQRIPQCLDPFKQIGAGIEIRGKLALAELARLEGLLANLDGEVEVQLSFFRDEQNIAVISGSVKSAVNLGCQRCLAIDAFWVDSQFRFALLRNESQIDNLPESYEPMILDKPELNVHAMIEEELILALPIVHFHSESCKKGFDKTSFGDVEQLESSKPNPFAVLEKLKN